MAPLCKTIIGIDVVPSFVAECRAHIDSLGLTNTKVLLSESVHLAFPDAEFDRIIMVDTIHHLEDVSSTLSEVHRLLKPDGLFLVFEPNKLNPLLAAMCALDPNERGLLRMGTFGSYRKLLNRMFVMEKETYNGLLIGPSGKLSLAVADLVSHPKVAPIAGWLSPKLFFAARKV
jgi:ubiquinone/menaquinone biosynthesis C-methylase UbiE